MSCNSHEFTQPAALFIDARAERSAASSCHASFLSVPRGSELPPRRGQRGRAVPRDAQSTRQRHVAKAKKAKGGGVVSGRDALQTFAWKGAHARTRARARRRRRASRLASPDVPPGAPRESAPRHPREPGTPSSQFFGGGWPAAQRQKPTSSEDWTPLIAATAAGHGSSRKRGPKQSVMSASQLSR